MKHEKLAIISLGSSIGSQEQKQQNILHACSQIHHQIAPLTTLAPCYTNPPWGDRAQNSFINTSAALLTSTTPFELLKKLHDIEASLGRQRQRDIPQGADRIIDLDVLVVFSQNQLIKMTSPDLTIPHPRLTQRPFMWWPLMDIVTALSTTYNLTDSLKSLTAESLTHKLTQNTSWYSKKTTLSPSALPFLNHS